MSELKSFEEMGRSYQERVLQALFEDATYAEMMTDVLEPTHFTFSHLQFLCEVVFSYRTKYKTFPSLDVAFMRLQEEFEERNDPAMLSMADGFTQR